MNAVEELQAAIDKLNTQMMSGDALEWVVSSWHDGTAIPRPWSEYDKSDHLPKPNSGFTPVCSTAENVALFVTLHRTISPQLALLNEALGYATDWQKANYDHRGPDPQTVYRKELTLARAINGVAS